jgi:hypothetical protein
VSALWATDIACTIHYQTPSPTFFSPIHCMQFLMRFWVWTCKKTSYVVARFGTYDDLILKVCNGHDVYQNANEPFRGKLLQFFSNDVQKILDAIYWKVYSLQLFEYK